MLNDLDLSMNRLSLGQFFDVLAGLVPKSPGLCKDLQLLDMSSNRLVSSIPDEIGDSRDLDILCNLSWTFLTGQVPDSFLHLS